MDLGKKSAHVFFKRVKMHLVGWEAVNPSIPRGFKSQRDACMRRDQLSLIYPVACDQLSDH